jgi:hypothetical protein
MCQPLYAGPTYQNRGGVHHSRVTTRALLARAVLAAGLALIAGGLLVGFLPRTASGVRCGSAFHGTSDAQTADYTTAIQADQAGLPAGPVTTAVDACNVARSQPRTVAVTLLILGAASTLAAAAAATTRD